MWATHWNDAPQPFVWTRTFNDIMTKVKRGRATLDCVTESAPTASRDRVRCVNWRPSRVPQTP